MTRIQSETIALLVSCICAEVPLCSDLSTQTTRIHKVASNSSYTAKTGLPDKLHTGVERILEGGLFPAGGFDKVDDGVNAHRHVNLRFVEVVAMEVVDHTCNGQHHSSEERDRVKSGRGRVHLSHTMNLAIINHRQNHVCFEIYRYFVEV